MEIADKKMNIGTESATSLEARQYQIELLEYVTHNNGIIYLPTGTGKTYIAILALKRFSTQMNRTIAEGGKRGVFMCNTVELARQQAVEIRKHTSLKVGLYLGEREVDSWHPQRWHEEINENQVLVGTVQVLLNIVAANFIKITDFSIIIIDECHHGTKMHPMHEFMKLFQYVPNQRLLPRVIGLTGVLLKGNKFDNLLEDLRSLEVTFRSKIVTITSKNEFLNVLINSTNPDEKVILYKSINNRITNNETIEMIVKECLHVVEGFNLGESSVKLTKGLASVRECSKKHTIKHMLNDLVYHLNECGWYCTLFVLESIQMKLRQSETVSIRRLFRFVNAQIETIRHSIYTSIKQNLDEKNPTNEDCHKVDIIFKFSTIKLTCLLSYLEHYFSGKERSEISCLIFVKRRLTAKSICSVIQRFVALKDNLKDVIFPEFMVGYNAMNLCSVDNVLEKKWNRQVLSDFRKGICNMIICSSVLEEGIDVQSCNHVIVFDRLQTFNSYIQTKGRARQKNAIYSYIVDHVDQNYVIEKVKMYQKTHEAIRKYLFERKLCNTSNLNQEEIDKEFDNKIPPLVTPQGTCLLPSLALSILNRYCQKLPWDAFGPVFPHFKKVRADIRRGFIVSAKLPLQSSVKEEILSDPMESIKLAKISAALNACRRLYEVGELNENLLPTLKTDVIRSISDVLFKHWEKHNDNVVSYNQVKVKKRLYEKKCPDELFDAIPILGNTCYAYKIVFTPQFEQKKSNKHVVEAMNSKSNYAILLRKSLPHLAEIPLFIQQGSLKARISEKPIEFCINKEDELQQLRKYHLMVMRDLLDCWRSYFVEDTRNKQNSYLIVPMLDDRIDWDIVKKFERLKPIVTPTLKELQNRNYNERDWLGKTVGKWCSSNNRKKFVVTKVLTDKSPLSFMDDKMEKMTYAEFFKNRYSNTIESIVNQKQFLIEVYPITTRRNFLNNTKSKWDIQKDILLPEICHNFEYPSDLWLKALFLPTILHRLHYMLHAENLRKRINSFLGLTKYFKNYKPKPLVIHKLLHCTVNNIVGINTSFSIQEERLSLPSLTSTHEESSGINELWNSYMELRNIIRQSRSIFPNELQYFESFTQKMQKYLEMGDEFDLGYLNQQFEMPESISSTIKDVSNFVNQSLVPRINAVSIDPKRHINILERSISNKMPMSNMNSAEQHEFLAALTASAANDIFDMERFELLGDSFLKFAVTLYLANKFPSLNEGFLTHLKSKLVSNRNLLYCLLETDISTCICSKSFSLDEWVPPLISLPENLLDAVDKNPDIYNLLSSSDLRRIKLSKDEVKNGYCNKNHFLEFTEALQCNKSVNSKDSKVNTSSYLSNCFYKDMRPDKIVADTLEALLGVCVKNYGFHISFSMLEYFGIIRTLPGDEPLRNLLDLKLGSNLLKTDISANDIDVFLVNYKHLEKNLGYTFHNRSYLLQALTHPSFPTNRLTGCYQELEFIGDAILDILVSSYIFERYEFMTPGMLTDLRSALVNNVTLGCICVRHRFHLFLLAENYKLAESICNFVEYQESHNYKVTDQVLILMEEDDIDPTETNDNNDCDENANDVEFTSNISVNVQVPKALGDIVESLIAAVYLDSRCLKTTWEVIYGMLAPELHEFGQKVPINPVRQLYEHPSANPIYKDPVVDNGTTMVKCVFSCLNKPTVVNGFGKNKLQAKNSAAKHALQILNKT